MGLDIYIDNMHAGWNIAFVCPQLINFLLWGLQNTSNLLYLCHITLAYSQESRKEKYQCCPHGRGGGRECERFRTLFYTRCLCLNVMTTRNCYRHLSFHFMNYCNMEYAKNDSRNTDIRFMKFYVRDSVAIISVCGLAWWPCYSFNDNVTM